MHRARLPKLCGADVELGNFVLGLERPGGTGPEASRALLAEIDGVPDARRHSCQYSLATGGGAPFGARVVAGNPQDWGRKYLLSNGGCAYIDLDHLELCIPEVLGAHDHVAAWHAMLRVAREALAAANARLPPGLRIQALVNNSDGRSNSYGSHLNFLLTRQAWDDLFHRKLHHMLYLAAYQVSSIVFTGQGKVGAENGAPPVGFQLSQRADFFETLVGTQTTHRRPIVNSRDEPLSGTSATSAADEMARLHSIFFDNTLCQGAGLLKVGVMQIVLAMIEAGRMNPAVILDEPLDAVVRWSHDPTLRARARLASGQELTAVEVQQVFLEDAREFVATGGCEGIVPRAAEILALWEDTLAKLAAGDLAALAPRLDWVLKLGILRRAMDRHPALGWESPQVRHLDQLYASLDPAEGLHWALARGGHVERVVPEAAVERFVHEPPEDTRAWGRTMLLRAAGRSRVDDADWDSLRLRLERPDGYWPSYRTVELADPLGFTRAATEQIFAEAETFEEVLEALDETRDTAARPHAVPTHLNGGDDHATS
jgi:proteasome accessory factor A